MLTIKRMIEGKCSLCMKDGEVVATKFDDGLEGTFCRAHFWEATKARSGIPSKKKTETAENGKEVEEYGCDKFGLLDKMFEIIRSYGFEVFSG